MIQKNFGTVNFLALLMAVLCVTQAQAQFQRGTGGGGFGGGGFGGGGGGNRAGGTSAGSTRQYYGNGTVGEAMISSDPESRRIIVITDEETGQYVSQVVTNLDRPKPQVLIKVVFLEVTHNNTLDIGIEGGFRRGLGNSTTSAVANVFGLSGLGSSAAGQTANPLGQPVGSFFPTPPGAGLYQIMSTDYQATLRAIATAGKTEVLSRPSIMARNNQPATITVGQSVPLITNVRYDTFGNAINSVQYTDVGIILKVTPFIHPNKMVEMIVSPEISSLTDQTVPISTGVSVPVIAKRAADTVVVTPDGQTVIIGGLMQNNKASNDSKIPFLGDIPVLGNLFKRKARNDTKTELIIFLTPKIADETGQLAAMTAKERDNAQLAPKAFTAEELNRYLDTLPAKDKSDVKSENKKK
jgi:general secretion pathway protein D